HSLEKQLGPGRRTVNSALRNATPTGEPPPLGTETSATRTPSTGSIDRVHFVTSAARRGSDGRRVRSMTIFDVEIGALRGGPVDLAQYRGNALLIVNVASQCGLTPQYAGLQQLSERYADRGLVVIGVPCNQFGAQEPGSPEEIVDFCQANYGVTFP